MGPAEIPLRALELGMDYARYHLRDIRPAAVPAQRFRAPLPLPDRADVAGTWEANAWHEDALRALLDGRITVNDREYAITGENPWTRCPDRGNDLGDGLGRLLLFHGMYAKANMQYIGTLNRHYHLVHLAKAVLLGKLDAAAVTGIMHDWIDANPYMTGVNWSDSLNHAIRVTNWCVALGLMGLDSVDQEISRSLHQQGVFIEKHLSFGSSAGNHLLGELWGLHFLGNCFPDLPRASRWRNIVRRKLPQQLELQFSAEGMHREQSVSYQRYLMEYFLLTLMCDTHLGNPLNSPLREVTHKGLRSLAQFVNAAGEVPFIGDHGHEITTDIHYQSYRENSLYSSVLRMGAVYFDDPGLNLALPDAEQRLPWLLSGEDWRRLAAMPAAAPVRESLQLPDAGLYLLRDGKRFEAETSVLVRCGPMGYMSLCAHAHADMLSFVMSVRGRQFLIDPGTYGYHFMGPKWRQYFRGTSAHNTLCLDGKSQARPGGAMIWLDKVTGRMEKWEAQGARTGFEGRHDGYGKAKPGAVHHRGLVLDADEATLAIDDWLETDAGGSLPAAVYFHFHPAVEIELTEHGLAASRGADAIRMRWDPRCEASVERGNEDTPTGWYSPWFGVRLPCYTLRLQAGMQNGERLRTVIDFAAGR